MSHSALSQITRLTVRVTLCPYYVAPPQIHQKCDVNVWVSVCRKCKRDKCRGIRVDVKAESKDGLSLSLHSTWISKKTLTSVDTEDPVMDVTRGNWANKPSTALAVQQVVHRTMPQRRL